MKGLPSSNDSQRSALLLSRCEATDSSISAERMSVVVDELHLTFLSAKVLLEHWNSPELSSEQRAERVTHLQSKIQQVADISLGRGNGPRGDLQTPNDRTRLSYTVNDSDIVTTGDRTTVAGLGTSEKDATDIPFGNRLNESPRLLKRKVLRYLAHNGGYDPRTRQLQKRVKEILPKNKHAALSESFCTTHGLEDRQEAVSTEISLILERLRKSVDNQQSKKTFYDIIDESFHHEADDPNDIRKRQKLHDEALEVDEFQTMESEIIPKPHGFKTEYNIILHHLPDNKYFKVGKCQIACLNHRSVGCNCPPGQIAIAVMSAEIRPFAEENIWTPGTDIIPRLANDEIQVAPLVNSVVLWPICQLDCIFESVYDARNRLSKEKEAQKTLVKMEKKMNAARKLEEDALQKQDSANLAMPMHKINTILNDLNKKKLKAEENDNEISSLFVQLEEMNAEGCHIETGRSLLVSSLKIMDTINEAILSVESKKSKKEEAILHGKISEKQVQEERKQGISKVKEICTKAETASNTVESILRKHLSGKNTQKTCEDRINAIEEQKKEIELCKEEAMVISNSWPNCKQMNSLILPLSEWIANATRGIEKLKRKVKEVTDSRKRKEMSLQQISGSMQAPSHSQSMFGRQIRPSFRIIDD